MISNITTFGNIQNLITKKHILILFFLLGSLVYAENIDVPKTVLKGIPFNVKIENLPDSVNSVLFQYQNENLEKRFSFNIKNNSVDTTLILSSSGTIKIFFNNEFKQTNEIRTLPGWLSIVPPLLAILLALILRQVIVSLIAGIYIGSVFIFDYNPLIGLFRVVDHYVITALIDPSHVSIIVFSMMIGGVVGVVSATGGMTGLANFVIRFARSSRSGMISGWLLGIFIFFDDYANTLIVGKLMRPITDRLRVSRQKLAYIVDSTSAPIASIFIISTWIGYEVGLIHDGLKIIGSDFNAYEVFLQTIPFRFYPIAAIFFVFLTSYMQRDFGPMYKAEKAVRDEGINADENSTVTQDLLEGSFTIRDIENPKWYNGAIPIFIILIGTFTGLIYTGYENLIAAGETDFSFRNLISNSDSSKSLLWASFIAGIIAVLMTVAQKIISLKDAVDAWFKGMRSMLLAMLILTLAWSLGAVTQELRTADYLISLLNDVIDPKFLPVLVFIICAITSFATGTSWGIMAIVMPLAVPLAHSISISSNLPPAESQIILFGVISSVLAGSVFGDHCSPISDTTIMSSMASSCDHIEHVRTQIPYSILIASVTMIFGDILTAYGVSPYIAILIIFGLLTAALLLIGKKLPNYKLR